MRNPLLPNREIHLDFHTSGRIPGVGEGFDADAFAQTFKEAGITAVCLFTRGHHGWCYYPSEVGEQHPHQQKKDLLGEQYEALKRAEIVPSLYTTVCWDELQAEKHPEWLCLRENGQVMKIYSLTGESLGTFQAGWKFLCWNSPYRDYVLAQSQEAVARFPDADYLFVDILFNDEPCCCPYCTDRMKKHGLDPNNPEDREKNSLDSAREFMEFLNAGVHEIVSDMPLFYNSRLRVTGDVEKGSKPELKYLGVNIVESLPSGPWGYNHFPLFARYFQNFKHKMMGHTGKFQKMWGDFGGLKNQAALDYEVMRMMAFGVVASIGDQLPPNGLLDKATYELIGKTYNKVSSFEKHLIGSEPVDEIAVMLSKEELRVFGSAQDIEYGSMKLLTQLQYQFSFVDYESDLQNFSVVVLPDSIQIDEAMKKKLESYIRSGGKILASYRSGFDESGTWALGNMPITVNGDYPYEPYYVYPVNEMKDTAVIEDTDHVQYLGGAAVKIQEGAESSLKVLAAITNPYFNRRWDHFCSHLQTPPNPDDRTLNPEMIYNGSNTVYFASKKFSCYNQFSSKCDKHMVNYGLELLLNGEKRINSNLPSTAEAVLRRSPLDENTFVLTILHYVPQRRTETIDIIEDTIPLHNIWISIFVKNIKVSTVMEAQSQTELQFIQKDDRVEVEIDTINGYTVLIIS
ncbi:MAG: alpha-L-fucosidase [Spirochaetia bacterium]|nr:alpha-L-fucosidase [Spirochaetia bacterium]MCF7946864.1 alpha-L-fucosidase [Spirochaetia bacterium]